MKNNIILAIALLLMLYACSKDQEEQVSASYDLEQFSHDAQVFIFNPDSAREITGNKGTRIFIKPNSFVKKDGSKPDTVTLELKEIYSKSQMIFNRLSTTSSGRLLETGGMLYMNAMSGKDTLLLKKQLRVTMPNKFELTDAQYFKGEWNGKFINWTLNEYETDTVITKARIVTLSYGADSVIVTKLRIVGNDTIVLDRSGFTTTFDYSVGEDWIIERDTVAILFPEDFLFSVNKLNWINCDRFYKNEDTLKLTVSHDQSHSVEGYLIFDDLSSVMPLFFINGQQTINVPNNESITVLAYFKDGENYQMYSKKIKSGKTTNLKLNFKPASLSQLKQEIYKLDK